MTVNLRTFVSRRYILWLRQQVLSPESLPDFFNLASAIVAVELALPFPLPSTVLHRCLPV